MIKTKMPSHSKMIKTQVNYMVECTYRVTGFKARSIETKHYNKSNKFTEELKSLDDSIAECFEQSNSAANSNQNSGSQSQSNSSANSNQTSQSNSNSGSSSQERDSSSNTSVSVSGGGWGVSMSASTDVSKSSHSASANSHASASENSNASTSENSNASAFEKSEASAFEQSRAAASALQTTVSRVNDVSYKEENETETYSSQSVEFQESRFQVWRTVTETVTIGYETLTKTVEQYQHDTYEDQNLDYYENKATEHLNKNYLPIGMRKLEPGCTRLQYGFIVTSPEKEPEEPKIVYQEKIVEKDCYCNRTRKLCDNLIGKNVMISLLPSNSNTRLCLDVAGNFVSENNVHFCSFNAGNISADQEWIISEETDGTYVIRPAMKKSLALDVDSQRNVRLNDYNNGPNQKWKIVDFKSWSMSKAPGYMLEPILHPGMVLSGTATRGGTKNDQNADIHERESADCQFLWIDEVN